MQHVPALADYLRKHAGLEDLLRTWEARLVGGTVRDLCDGLEPKDIDLATPWLPHRVEAWLRSRGAWVHSQGAAFGTITGRLASGALFECTTLREDTATDGRHAVVRYTTDWARDAHRRDFACNSLSLDAEGRLFDYTDGLEDVRHRRVRFIGNPVDRIVEDHLRLWRYLRFLGRWPGATVDRPSYEAVCREAWRVRSLSADRTRLEMKRLLPMLVRGGSLVDEAVTRSLFEALGPGLVLQRLPLLEGFREEELDCEDYWMALVEDADSAAHWLSYWGMNRRHRMRWTEVMALAMEPWTPHRMVDLGDRLGSDWALRYLRQTMLRQAELVDGVDRERYDRWVRRVWPVFPVTGSLLQSLGYRGPALGARMALLRDYWRRTEGYVDLSTLLFLSNNGGC